jgi:hypothetical protein
MCMLKVDVACALARCMILWQFSDVSRVCVSSVDPLGRATEAFVLYFLDIVLSI